MEYWLTALIILLAALVVGNLLTGVIQEYFIFRPERLPEGYAFTFQRPYEEIFISSPKNGRLHGLWFKQDTREKARGVILYFHGNSGSVRRWGHLHYFFNQMGYDYFTFDYRGFGKSKGPRTQELMCQDSIAVYDFIQQHYTTEEIVIFGRSLGSAFASWLAGRVEAKLVVLETPFASMRHLFRAYFPFLPPLFYFKFLFPNYRWLKKVPMPVYIFQGDEDLVVPFKVAAVLKSSLKPGDEFFKISGGSHNNLLYFDKYVTEMKRILELSVERGE